MGFMLRVAVRRDRGSLRGSLEFEARRFQREIDALDSLADGSVSN